MSTEKLPIENLHISDQDSTSPRHLSETLADVLYFESDFQNFINSQITYLIEQERKQNPKLKREEELEIAIDYCKKYLLDASSSDEQKRSDVMAMLVDLKLEMEQYKVGKN